MTARDPDMNHEHPDIESQQSAADAAAAAGVNDEVERLRAEVEQIKADALRERADLENQRKRVARDIEQARKFANEKLLGELLPVFDSLDAGLKAAGDDPHPLCEGLALTYKQYYPDVDVIGAYNAMMPEKEMWGQVGVGLNIPLYRRKRHAAVSEAEFRLSQRQPG